MINKLKSAKNIYFVFYIVIGLFSISSIIFVDNNHNFYDQPIAKVTESKVTEQTQMIDSYENEATLYTQTIVAELKNGEDKGKEIHITNKYSSSGAYDFEYNTGDELFVSLDKKEDFYTGRVKNIKRDKYIIISMWIFFFILLFVGRKQGLFATVSLAINIFLLSWGLDFYVNHHLNLIWIFSILIILQTIISLLLMNGRSEKTYAAMIATILGTYISVFITYLAIWFTSGEGLYYEEMSFLTRPHQLVFLAGLFIGGLGAVMDVAISISSSLYEIYQKDPDISNDSLRKIGFNIGQDIMGTMTNILFFAYLSGSIPVLVVYLKNASPLGFALSTHLSLEIARALAGGIGIVITIPIAIYTSIFFINRKRVKL